MGLFGKLKYAIPGVGPMIAAKDAAKKGIKWAGQKSAGATDVNNRLEDRYNYLTGGDDRKGISNRSRAAGFGLSAPETSPLKGFISDTRDRYNEVKGRSDALFDELGGTFRSFMGPHGGLDPSRIANIEGDISGFRDIGRYGAADAAGANRIRGNGVFEEFSKTGGYSDADKANIRSRIASQTPSFFASLRRRLDQQNRVNNGLNPGYTSQMSKMARDAGQEGTAAVREGEIALQEAVNSGRKWGTEGMSASERAIVANMLAGLEGASSTEMGLMDMIRSGQMFGAQGLEGLRTTPGADLAYSNQLLQALGLEGDQIMQVLGLMSDRNPNASNWDKYGGQIMGGLGSLAGMFAGGPAGASMGGKIGGEMGPNTLPISNKSGTFNKMFRFQ